MQLCSTHYPVFHQMEGLRVFESHEWAGQDSTDFCLSDLKKVLEGLAKHLFGEISSFPLDGIESPKPVVVVQVTSGWPGMVSVGLL